MVLLVTFLLKVTELDLGGILRVVLTTLGGGEKDLVVVVRLKDAEEDG